MRRFWCWIGGHIPATDNILDNIEHPWRDPRNGEPTTTQETKITVVSHRLLVRERVCIRCGAALGAKEKAVVDVEAVVRDVGMSVDAWWEANDSDHQKKRKVADAIRRALRTTQEKLK